jgi:hypothetical protein
MDLCECGPGTSDTAAARPPVEPLNFDARSIPGFRARTDSEHASWPRVVIEAERRVSKTRTNAFFMSGYVTAELLHRFIRFQTGVAQAVS